MMKKKKFDNFEILLMMVAEESADNIGDEFMKLDTSNVQISRQVEKKIKRYIRAPKRSSKYLHPVRIILVACLLAMSIAFTACVCIPQIREAIKNVIVQWYDGYLTIDFSNGLNNGTTTTHDPSEDIPKTPPTTIERKAYAVYLPEDYSCVMANEAKRHCEFHYNDRAGNLIFILYQDVIDGELQWNDDENIDAQEILVNGQKAFLISYIDEPNIYSLIWRDHSYQYTLYGYFENQTELVKVAENITLQ